MSILVDRHTRVLVQGITGSAGRFHAEQMLSYGTRVVAGKVGHRARLPRSEPAGKDGRAVRASTTSA